MWVLRTEFGPQALLGKFFTELSPSPVRFQNLLLLMEEVLNVRESEGRWLGRTVQRPLCSSHCYDAYWYSGCTASRKYKGVVVLSPQ